ncbi:MAG: PIN domain-containing protein [Anaeromyxobacter sp.]
MSAPVGGRYIETSALLRVLLDGDEGLRAEVAGEGLFTSALTFAEAQRALQRVRREGRLPEAELRLVERQLTRFARSCAVMAADEGVLERAGRAFPVEPVRTLDAIHLATALALSAADIDVEVVSCDQRVRDNAIALGFRVTPAA